MHLVWDQGTLLLRDAPAAAAALPGVLWDPRVGAWRAPAHRHAEIVAAAEAGDLALTDSALAPVAAPPALTAPDLRPYQEAALGAWALDGRRGIVVLPTGAGKTRTALAAIASTRLPALVLVPTRVLLEQWVVALQAAGLPEVGRYGDGARSLASVTVATVASALRHLPTLGNRFPLLVVDEAHHFGSPQGDEPLEMSTARCRLGLTATPPDGARLSRLEALLGPVVYRASITELAGRFLAPFQLFTLTLSLTPAERQAWEAEQAVWRPVVRRFFTTTPEASWPDFVVAAQQSDEGRRALVAHRNALALLRLTEAKADVLGRLLGRHARSRLLVFAPDAATALEISRRHLVPAITADIGRAERARLLQRFAEGAVRALVSARVLNEGLDVPAADVAVIVGGTSGERAYVQRVGRVLRPEPGKEALIYELVVAGTTELARLERRRRRLATA